MKPETIEKFKRVKERIERGESVNDACRNEQMGRITYYQMMYKENPERQNVVHKGSRHKYELVQIRIRNGESVSAACAHEHFALNTYRKIEQQESPKPFVAVIEPRLPPPPIETEEKVIFITGSADQIATILKGMK